MTRLSETLQAYQQRDPAARSKLEIFLLYPGVHATLYYRLAHWCYLRNWRFLARWISQHARRRTGIEIHPGAKIGRRLVIDHGAGIVIGETTEIGDDVLLYQCVTLGGTGKEKGKRHPTIESNVMIGAGAKILGPFTVGHDARIASNAVVLSAVPAGSTAVGVPAKIVRVRGKASPHFTENMDQIHVSDPMQEALSALSRRMTQLEEKERKNEHAAL